MRYVDEYRDARMAQRYAQYIQTVTAHPWTVMEICGGQTHAIARFGIPDFLPDKLNLVHGPGCPVCVTPLEMIDKAILLARQPNVILCSFGDMLRVPGSMGDLLSARSDGGQVRIVYSPLDALAVAQANPDQQVVFFAVGFETTAPANAMAVYQAAKNNLCNFSLLVSHVLVPPAMEAILSSPDNLVQGFLAAGHVCTIMGYADYEPLALKYKVPIVITGFEPLDILQGLAMCVRQLERGEHRVENQYSRSVSRQGNLPAQKLIAEIFQVVPRQWRGLGEIPASGLGLTEQYRSFDAEIRFQLPSVCAEPLDKACISGEILQGRKKPFDCPEFGQACTPDHPLGAPMVSSEGACSAYYRYQRLQRQETCS